MLELFDNLAPAVQSAVIGACATIMAAIIAGIFSLVKKSKKNKNDAIINQKQGLGNKGTQIGVKNNYNNNTTIAFGNTTVDAGTLIIDCGNASGGGIRFAPTPDNDKSGENKNE